MGVIKKVGDGVKRLCAVLVACVVMWYSVITAPLFGVHAASIPETLIAFTDWLSSEVISEFELPGAIGAVVSLMRPFAEKAVSPGVSAPIELPRPVPSGCYYGNYYWEVESGSNVDQVNIYSYTWDYSNLDTSQGVYISNAISSSYFSIDISVIPSEDWKASSSADNRSIVVSLPFSSGSGSNSVGLSISASDSSGITPSYIISYIVRYNDGSSYQHQFSIARASYYKVWARILWNGSVPTFSQDTLGSWISSNIGSSPHPNASIYLTFGSGNASVSSSSFPVMSSPLSSDQDIINYYDNSVRPTYKLQYQDQPDIANQFITYNEFVDQYFPADPSETTSPGTGVIIIDPFTLPPEWVESDVVELETDHYEVPFESMVADPFDYLVSPYTQTSTETVRGAMKTVPISPPSPQYQVFPSSGNVQETAVGFVNLAYTLLNRSGLDYVIGIAVFGLCVSLLVL